MLTENFFLPLIQEKDPEAAIFLKRLDEGIQIADDVIDKKVGSEAVVDLLSNWSEVFRLISLRPALYRAIALEVAFLFLGFLEDLSFVPGRRDVESELAIWARRGGRATIGFKLLCFVDPRLDLEENWAWVKIIQSFGLMLNDCQDLISEEFEDLYQGRRNFVLLKYFGMNIYKDWKLFKREIVQKALVVKKEIVLPPPKDERLMLIYDELKKVLEG